METIHIAEDISLFTRVVPTFPMGIEKAFNSIIEELGMAGRKNYGVSSIEPDGLIRYRVAMTKKEGEGDRPGLTTEVISKGDYLAVVLRDWMPKVHLIKGIFEKMMDDPRCDMGYPCVEWYKDDREMTCMAKMK